MESTQFLRAQSKRKIRALPTGRPGRKKGTHYDEGGDGLVDPAALLEEVPDHDASAEQRHKEVDGDHRGMVRCRQYPQAHELLRHQAKRHG